METRSNDDRRHGLRRALATAGVAGAAITLAAMPALATPPGSHSHSHDSTASKSHSSSSQSHTSQSSSNGADGHGASATSSNTSGHNPPGNNGTVFIHDVAGDQSPHNVPHVSCNFYVDFFGFDNGQVVTVSFAGQAPTGKDIALGGTWTGVVSDDDASGAGNDFDKELAYTADDLGVTSLGAPSAQQGYHVKMTVATNEPGGKKSKVFWISPCATVVGGTTGAGTIAGTTGSVLGTSLGSPTGATMTSRPGRTTVLGEKFTRPAAVAGSSTGLPFTGADIWRMVAAGLVALAAGAAVAAGGRRRRTQ